MKKRMTAGIMAFLWLFLSIFTSFVPGMDVKAAGKTLIIHYGGREDQTYEGWNLWVWEEGKEGQQVDFIQEDSFGQIAVYQTSGDSKSVGFIVRLHNWEAKDVEDDRFVSMDGNVVEIWLTSGDPEIVSEAPNGAESFDFAALEEERLHIYDQEDAIKINVHYYNFAQKYEKDAEVYAWLGEEAGAGYPFVEKDSFGALFHIGFLADSEVKMAGVTISDTTSEGSDLSYELDLSQARDKVLDVYVVEGNETCWYEESEVVYDPVIASCAFKDTTSAKIDVVLSKELEKEDASIFHIVDGEGNTYGISEISAKGKNVTVTLEEELSLSKSYVLTIDGYVETGISMDKILGSDYFDEQLAYDGDDLGVTYTKEASTFKVWAPMASEVLLNLYETGDGDTLLESLPMIAGEKGVWTLEKQGDLNGVYYTFSITNGKKTEEAVDLYARTTGVNGDRGMVLDLASTDPEGFLEDVRPAFENDVDAIIYELHVRDLSSDFSSGIQNTGKFLGLTELDTKNADGISTGLSHILDLGVTHIQLQPSYDYATVDESKIDSNQFNWGYDPKNYNVPEGSYSTDPFHGEVRVQEMKQMVQALHQAGLRVNMDVVYNHTYSAEESWFQKTVPDYYYRKNGEKYSNGSGCGNETASERAMVRKYIVDSVTYWATEYHIDGFRFDLMALHDVETMQAVRAALDEIDPTIMVYGEGWTGGDSMLSRSEQCIKSSMYKLEGVGAFSDDIRDGIKGNVFDALDQGFVSGKTDMEESIKYGVVGAIAHPGVMMSKNSKGTSIWAAQPGQSINYISCHDNLTFWDKLATSNATDPEEDRIKMNQLGSAIIMTSQGVPFLLAGEEMRRSKPSATKEGQYDENSYCSPDSTNSIKWDTLGDVAATNAYYKDLIAFRKAHSAFRMVEASDIQQNLTFMTGLTPNVVAYTINGHANQDTAEKITVIYNANKDAVSVPLTSGSWDIVLDGTRAGNVSLGTAEGSVSVEGISAMVLVQGDSSVITEAEAKALEESIETTNSNLEEKSSKKQVIYVVVGCVVVVLLILVVTLILRKNKKN